MILLVCDHKKRELHSLKKLKRALMSKNIRAEIVNKHCIIKAYNYYKPKIITFPHCNAYLTSAIDKLKSNVKKILIPTEHCAFVEKFLEIQYLGILKNRKSNNLINKMDLVFSQSEFIKKYLLKKTKLKKNQIFNSGHLFYNNWETIKGKKNKVQKIGIALTNEYILRRFNDNNFLKNLYELNEHINLSESYWRLRQMNYDQYYFCLIFELVKKLSKNYQVNIRTHIVDNESDFSFLENKNVSVSKNQTTKEWLLDQDLVISTVSFINVDSYIYNKPHISLSKLIPKEFYFEAYQTFNYNEFPEINSFTPTSQKELLELIKKIRFKKNKKLSFLLKKFFSFPYKKTPVSIISDKIEEILMEQNKKKFKYILTNNEISLSKIIGSRLTVMFSYLFSQIKLFKNKKTVNSYYDFFFIFK